MKGPTAAAIPPRPDQAPIAGARSSRTNAPWIIARLPGVSRPPPMPCSSRATTRVSAVGAIPHSSEAIANHTVPITNSRRRPNRSPSEPPSRISEASNSRYPLLIHCSSAKEASRSSPMVRSATLTTVPSRRVRPDPRLAAATTHRPVDVPSGLPAALPHSRLSAYSLRVTGPRAVEQRLRDHVDRLGEEHPPIDLATVDFTVRDPATTTARFGHVLDYMARVELEVDRTCSS